MPGSGKSTFVRGLEGRGWGVLIGDELEEGTEPQRVWDSALARGDDRGLFAKAEEYSAGLGIEFGFPSGWLPKVQAMTDRGYETWYFDADREASKEAWTRVHPGTDERAWSTQADALEAGHGQIAAVYGPRLIKTLTNENGHLEVQRIADIVGVAW
jgi:hypothetical protein